MFFPLMYPHTFWLGIVYALTVELHAHLFAYFCKENGLH